MSCTPLCAFHELLKQSCEQKKLPGIPSFTQVGQRSLDGLPHPTVSQIASIVLHRWQRTGKNCYCKEGNKQHMEGACKMFYAEKKKLVFIFVSKTFAKQNF
eukprot:scpid58753/ scgid15536/ 